MKTFLKLLVLVAITFASAQASEVKFPKTLKLEGGTTLKDIRLLSKTPSEIVVHHSSGVKNLKIAQLSPKVQELLEYSAADAAAYDKQALELNEKQRTDKAAREVARKEAKVLKEKIKEQTYMIRGKVSQVISGAILVEPRVPSTDYFYGTQLSRDEDRNLNLRKYSKSRPEREFGWTLILNHPNRETLATGDIIDINAYRDGAETIGEITAKKFFFLEDYTPADAD